jgi:hypothetical protein
MRSKALLLGSVSVVATAAGANAAHAQSAGALPAGYIYSVQGGALFSTNTTFSDKAAAFSGFPGTVVINDFPTDVGYTAGLSIGKQIDNAWDVNFAASVNRLIDNSGTTSGSSSSGGTSGFNLSFNATTSFAYETGDFEVGFRPMLGNDMKVRLFGGVRALHFTESLDKAGAESFFNPGGSGFESFTSTGTSEFFGAGPRIGLSVTKRFEGSNFGLSGSVAGAAIIGRQTSSFQGTAFFTSGGTTSGGTFGSAASETKTVIDLEGSLGLDYYLDDNTTLTAGYHAEDFTNILSDNSNFLLASGGSVTNKLVHGPFLKLTGGF